jgi:UDP-N-acetylglucosamine/UDP-N-acetylgalactosamine 4-epimerase
MNKKYHSGPLNTLNFLVTGGAGFIGSHIVDYLMENNAGKVRVVDNLSTGSMHNIEHHIDNQNFEFLHGDLTNIEVCSKACEDIDVVFHQAALGSVPRSIEQPLNTNNHNVNGHLNILWTCVSKNIQRVVFASSSSVYGDDNHFPKNEQNIGMPLSPYAVSKRVNELYAHVFASLYDLRIIGLRYFNVFGPRQNPKGPYAAVIPLFIDALKNHQTPVIFGNGEQSRDFTYVENIVQANILAAFSENKEAFGKIMNIGAGGSTSVNQLFQIIADALQSSTTPEYKAARKGDVLQSSASVDLAKQLIDYSPVTDIHQGIALTIQSFAEKI